METIYNRRKPMVWYNRMRILSKNTREEEGHWDCSILGGSYLHDRRVFSAIQSICRVREDRKGEYN